MVNNILNIRFMDTIPVLKNKYYAIMDGLKFDDEFREDIVSSMINLMKAYFEKDDNEFIKRDKEVDRYILISSISCFWISCKFHDDEMVHVSDLEYLTTFSHKDILRYEKLILKTLDFNIYSHMSVS
jgi:hypothetical protein